MAGDDKVDGPQNSLQEDHAASSSGSSSSSSSSSSSTDSSGGDSDGSDDPKRAMMTSPPLWDEAITSNLSEDNYIQQTREWTQRVPMGWGLCPWATKSWNQGQISIVCTLESTPELVAIRLRQEAQRLVAMTDMEDICSTSLHTTLLVCPKVEAWNHCFDAFDAFVADGWKEVCDPIDNGQRKTHEHDDETNTTISVLKIQQDITLVSFHPLFLRWRGLPKGVRVGSKIQAYQDMGGFQKSSKLEAATILETTNKVFGRRKIRVEFADGTKQYVPVNWCVFQGQPVGDPLPDNRMHQSPFPTIHIIRNRDLGRLRARDVSRVKRKNAHRMIQL